MTTIRPATERGVVLPVALILLVIVSFAGLFAARSSANHEQFSNNLRTANVARQAAELGVRFCERVVIDLTDNDGEELINQGLNPDQLRARIAHTAPGAAIAAPDTNGAVWLTLANWADDNRRILVPIGYGTAVKAEAQLANNQHCMIETMTEDRFLITARGLSNDAQLDANGRLIRGSEIWLQSILRPGAPLTANAGGIQ